MYNKIIYPIIIILFSILFIYGILMKNENIKFNNKVENFLDKTLDNLKNGITSNVEFTKKFINGNWTCLTTKVDSNYNVTNLMKVNINEQQNNNNKNYGNIIIDNSTYNIILLTNENIIANIENNNSTIHIKLINKFNKNDDKLDEKLIYKNDIPKCIISQYIGNNLLYQYISYKVYNNKVNSELYRIILSGNYYTGKLPPIYNYQVYNKILNNYIYPANYILVDSFNNGPENILNILRNKYNGFIKFSIQRIFYSPSYGNTEIITKLSPPILLNVLQGNSIANKLKIVSFNDDKNVNGLKQFLRPKATILYFYVFTDSNDSYDYKENHIAIPTDFLSLSWFNRAQNMFNNNVISFDNILSVEKIVTNNFSLAKVSKKNSDMENSTFFDFSDLYPLL